MKKTFILLVSAIIICAIYAADKLRLVIKNSNATEMNISGIDSITFSGEDYLLIHKNDKTSSSYALADIDSLKFTGSPDTVSITFSQSSVTVNNPLSGQGVDVTVSGTDVVVNSVLSDNEVRYLISGSSSDGSLKFYSACKLELILNGLTLTNADGPAINNQSTKRTTITLAAGTTNTLTDGSTYASSTEDQKGTLFSEGQLIFNGTGNLSVQGNKGHAICSDDYIEIEGGIITVTGAVKDGIHSKDHFNLENGTVLITAAGDAIECEAGKIKVEGGSLTSTISSADAKGLKCDSTLNVTGGTIYFTVSGNQAKGLKSGGVMNLSGGTITINTSGAAVTSAYLSGYDVSYCTAIKCDTTINISGSAITVSATGIGGKGISSDQNINISNGTINITNSGNGATYTNSTGTADAYAGSGIEADGNIYISAGNVTIVSSGTATKGISADGTLTIGSSSTTPVVNVTNSGTKLLVSGTANYTTAVYAEPKALKSDGDMILNSGTYTLSTSQQGSEIVDTDANLNVNGGNFTLTLGGNQSKGLKSTGAMTLAGGTIGITATGGVVLENVAAATYDPSYCAAIKPDGLLTISGANITINHSGAGGKGISATAGVNMTGGVVKITTSGAGSTYKNSSGTTDSYSTACISSDTNINILDGSLTTSSSGNGGKGLKADGAIIIGSSSTTPTLSLTTTGAMFTVSSSTSTGGGGGGGSSSSTDYCHPKTLVSDGDITINSGNITISSSDDGIKSETSITINGGTTTIANSTEGIESKTITMNGGAVYVTASDDGINATASTQAGGTETTDASYFYMKGGVLTTVATSGDAVDSNGNFQMTGGTLVAFGPSNSTNEDIDVNGNILINGGTFLGACMNSSMFESITSSSTQVGVNLKASSTVSTSKGYFRIQDASGNDLGTFITPNAYYYFHFSSPSLKTSTTFYIYTGGSYSGGTTKGGYCTGGTYSNGTQKKTFTTSSSKISTLSI